jgi:hypothetical protein
MPTPEKVTAQDSTANLGVEAELWLNARIQPIQ